MPQHILIVGDGPAGATALRAARQRAPSARITVVADDPNPAYFRAALTNYLLGHLRPDQLFAFPPSYYADQGVERLTARVEALDLVARRAELSTGQRLPFDRVLIAAGARARPAPFPGGDLPGVVTLRTMQDANSVLDRVAHPSLDSVVLVGGGPLALELAHGLKHQAKLRDRPMRVVVVLRGDCFLRAALDAEASKLVEASLHHADVDVVLHDEVAVVESGDDGAVASVRLASGRAIDCQLVAVAIGVLPNTEMLRDARVLRGSSGTVRVDRQMRLLDPEGAPVDGAFAAGDLAETDEGVLQLWQPAQEQGLVAGGNLTGASETWCPGAHYFATRLFDLDFAAIGRTALPPRSGLDRVRRDRGQGRADRVVYQKLVFDDDRLVGALLLGSGGSKVRARGRQLKRLIDTRAPIPPEIADRMLEPGFDLRAWTDRHTQVASPLRQSRRPAPPGPSGGTPPRPAPGGARRGAAAARLSAIAQAAPTVLMSAPSASSSAPPARIDVGSLQIDLGETPTGLLLGASAESSALGALLAQGGASQVHSHISTDHGCWWVRDLGSAEGTFVNGARVTTPVKLTSGDRILIGTQELRFREPQVPEELWARVTLPGKRPRVFRLGNGAIAGSAPDVDLLLPAAAPTEGRFDRGPRGWTWRAAGSGAQQIVGPLQIGGAHVIVGAPDVLGLRSVRRAWELQSLFGGTSKRHLVPVGGLTLGRDLARGVSGIGGPRVSATHLRVEPCPYGLLVRDVRSRWGTTVDGEPLGRAPLLATAGDELLAGTQTVVRVL